MNVDLEDLEAAAHLVLEEDEENVLSPRQNVNNLVTDFGGLTIIENGAALGDNENVDTTIKDVVITSRREGLAHLSDSDSSSSDSEDDSDEDDEESDSSDSSEDDSSDEDDREESSSDSSELDSDDTLSDNDDDDDDE